MKPLLILQSIIFLNQCFTSFSCTPPSFNNLTVQSDFNLNRFLDLWYEIKWLPNYPHTDSDIWRNYYQSFQLTNPLTQKLLVYGRARLLNNETCFSIDTWSINANNSAKMILEKKNIYSNQSFNWPYYILQTDYDHYALIYTCTDENYTYTSACSVPALWLFSRTTTLSTNYSTKLDNYIQNTLCINLTQLEITPQDGQSCYVSVSSSTKHFINIIFIVHILIIHFCTKRM